MDVSQLMTASSAGESLSTRRERRSLGSADALTIVDCLLAGATLTREQLVTIRAQAGFLFLDPHHRPYGTGPPPTNSNYSADQGVCRDMCFLPRGSPVGSCFYSPFRGLIKNHWPLVQSQGLNKDPWPLVQSRGLMEKSLLSR
jgi:hypothetical protein